MYEGEKEDKLANETGTGGEERRWERGKYAKVYEGGEEVKLASKTGAGGYEDKTNVMEKYEVEQEQDDETKAQEEKDKADCAAGKYDEVEGTVRSSRKETP